MGDKKKKTLRSSSGKVVKNISDKKNASIHKYRTTGSGPKRSVKEGHTASGRKTGRSQYVSRVKTVSKIKPRGKKRV